MLNLKNKILKMLTKFFDDSEEPFIRIFNPKNQP